MVADRAPLHSSPRFVFPGQSWCSGCAGSLGMRRKADHVGAAAFGRRLEDLDVRSLPQGYTNSRQTGMVCTHRFKILTNKETRRSSPTSFPLSFHNRSPLTLHLLPLRFRLDLPWMLPPSRDWVFGAEP